MQQGWESLQPLYLWVTHFFFFGVATAVLRDLRASLFSSKLANEVGLVSLGPPANYSGFSNFCAGCFSVIGLNCSGSLHQGIRRLWMRLWATWIPRPFIEGAYALHLISVFLVTGLEEEKEEFDKVT